MKLLNISRGRQARRQILPNINTLFTSISSNVKSIPIRTMTDTIAAFATARLPAEVHLLAIGDEIVHLLTVSLDVCLSQSAIQEFVYRPDNRNIT